MNQEQHDMLVRIDERTQRLDESKDDHEKRLRSLERIKNWFLGLLAASGIGVGTTLKSQ